MINNNLVGMMTVESTKFKEDYADILSEVADYYESKYNGKIKLNDMDIYAIGKYTETVSKYAPFMEENDVSGLGGLNNAVRGNLGLTATQYATSIVPLLASVQPTEQELALIYYKEAIATTNRGGIKAGDEVLSRFGKTHKDLDQYISDEQSNTEIEFVEANNAAGFTAHLLAPVRPGTVVINVQGKVNAIDNGEGAIFGSYIDPTASSINYETGELKLKLMGHAGLGLVDNKKVDVVYTQLVFNNDVISGFKYNIKSEAIKVDYYPLQVTYDLVNDFVTKRQFGQTMNEFAEKDVIYQINKAISGAMIKKLRNAAIKNEAELGTSLTWSVTAPAGVALTDHRATFRDIYDMAISSMEKMSGLGGISAIVVGGAGRRIFTALGIGTSINSRPGAYVLGFDGEIPVIYASSDYMDADEVLFVYKGDFFETAAVYAPFLPLLSVNVQGRDHNVFQKTTGTATGAAMKVVNQGFVQRVKLTN